MHNDIRESYYIIVAINTNGVAKINTIKIIIKDNPITSNVTDNLSTTFYIDYQGKFFPDNQWIDITNSILDTWTYIVLKSKGLIDSKFELFFMDGPYRLDVTKDKFMQLTINCVNFRYEEICEYTIKCSYVEFLSALYNATKFFNYILFSNRLNKGKFESVFNQSVMAQKELKSKISGII